MQDTMRRTSDANEGERDDLKLLASGITSGDSACRFNLEDLSNSSGFRGGAQRTRSSMATVVIKAQKRMIPMVSILVRPYGSIRFHPDRGGNEAVVTHDGVLVYTRTSSQLEVISITVDETRSICA